MKALKYLLIVAGVVGCTSLPKSNVNNIFHLHKGMTEDQVTEILGEPFDKNGGLWTYNILADGYGTQIRYYMMFKDGKIETYKADEQSYSSFQQRHQENANMAVAQEQLRQQQGARGFAVFGEMLKQQQQAPQMPQSISCHTDNFGNTNCY